MHSITASAPPRRIIRLPELRELIPVNPSTLWRWEQTGDFPRRVELGPNSVGWFLDEIHAWQEKRRRQQTDASRPSPNPRAKRRGSRA
jgi:prophage regulatory protein